MSVTALQRLTITDLQTLSLVLVSNALPVIGVVFLGWRAAEILVLYWIEIIVMVAAYSVAALFAKQPIILEGRDFYIVGFSRDEERNENRWNGEPEPVGWVEDRLPDTIASRLPPIYRRNIPVVRRSLGIVVFLAILWGYLSNSVSNPIAALTSPVVILGSVAICTSQLAELRREFFVPETYEDWSPYMVLETAQRVVVFYLVLGVFAVPFIIIGVALSGLLLKTILASSGFLQLLALPSGVDWPILLYVTIFSACKAMVDWSRRVVGIKPDAGGLSGWFTPENPHLREWQQERNE